MENLKINQEAKIDGLRTRLRKIETVTTDLKGEVNEFCETVDTLVNDITWIILLIKDIKDGLP